MWSPSAQPIHAQSTDPQLPQIAPTAPEALPDPTLPDQTPPDQTPPDQALPDQAVPDQGFTDQNFTGIAIVALEDLPPELKTQAEAVITQEDLLTLQSSIDASPQAATALAASGLDSSQVVAANIDGNGTLTLIIQTTT
ncbi:hypothetical protein [Mesorhizobium wenxiniae]|uniref:hypothetical protein n=1 Tax=Mesorhizobium wenxiniae TaxID=2014805 RepID=UPI001FD87FA4|nr:hypothetical protein [Mesorhizobium wenxiniae]